MVQFQSSFVLLLLLQFWTKYRVKYDSKAFQKGIYFELAALLQPPAWYESGFKLLDLENASLKINIAAVVSSRLPAYFKPKWFPCNFGLAAKQ